MCRKRFRRKAVFLLFNRKFYRKLEDTGNEEGYMIENIEKGSYHKNKFFPLYFDISQKRIVFIGGGTIASRRIQVLMEFEADILVIAPEVCEAVFKAHRNGSITYIDSVYKEEYLLDADIVLACTNDEELNHEIYMVCKKKGIVVNNCSNKEECDFQFPAIIQRDSLVIGINSGGEDHRKVKQTRELIEDLL